jgi:hypothetical protein
VQRRVGIAELVRNRLREEYQKQAMTMQAADLLEAKLE